MKKLNKFFAVLVALAMMATLCVSMAFAEYTGAKGESLETTGFTKYFEVPDDVTSPKATFNFTITPAEGNPSGSADAILKTISFDKSTGQQHGFVRLSDVFTFNANDQTGLYKITQPGEYTFTVKEVPGAADGVTVAPTEGNASYYLRDADETSTEKVTFDSHEYTLRIFVIKKTDGTLGTSAITVIEKTKTSDSDKIDPTEIKKEIPGEDGEDPTYEPTGTSAWAFTNDYSKKIHDESADGAFNVSKKVTNSGDTAKPYTFTVTVHLDPQAIADNNLTALTAKNTYTGENETATISKNIATFSNVKLADGKKLVFTDFYAGSTVDVVEALKADTSIQNSDKYTKSVKATDIDLADDAKTQFTKDEDVDVSTKGYDKKSNVEVTNDLANDAIEPEGILISNLPYIALALVAIGGLVAYVVVRRRNADEA